ncbi:MAG: response regulator [Candidatus Tectomicrobia bacterium]|uniref:Response regulator n=1 Tax=Tectimicrobiota bacterium TaxID=2528274 RepID=A0A937W659_UNCTE|nr:response regulator [Candidatus Tectomicrobia bacterium]
MATILVVDDSPTALKAITDTLRGTGHWVITAMDGDQGLHKALHEHPDLILLDVVMPGKNGFQVCRQLKTAAATKDIKIILITSKDQPSDRFWGLKQGADAYITKPFEEAELRASVAKCL